MDFGAELQTVAGQFDGLSQGFTDLGAATQAAPGTVGPAFQALMQNFHLLGVEGSDLGAQANALISDLRELQHPQGAVTLAAANG